jgi:iron(III) transport system substrate-binding protein
MAIKDFRGKNPREVVMLLVVLVLIAFAVPLHAQEKGWEQEWRRIVAEARKEGTVVVMGSADPDVRRLLPAAFKERFGISLEYIGGRGGDLTARLRVERQAGQYTVDATFGGLGELGANHHSEGWLDPLRPALILPEVVDPKKWKVGKLWFLDPEEKYVLRLYNYITGGILSMNTNVVKPGELKSIKDLLQPKWRGKVSVYDPTTTGTGSQDATRFFVQFGEDFVKKLYVDQQPAFSRDKRQLADWLGHGTYPISLGVETEGVIRMKEQGLPVDLMYLPDSPGTLSAGNGLLGLMNKAPHPNAARVFVNWIASKEGLEILGRARRKPTTRADIDESYVPDWEIPKPGPEYFDSYTWENAARREKVIEYMRELLKSRGR